MEYSDEQLHEDAETLVRADEIQNDKDLMKVLEPYMKERMMRIDKVLSLKDLWNQGKARLAQEENEKEMKSKLSAEEEEPELKNTKDKGEDPLKEEKLKVAKS